MTKRTALALRGIDSGSNASVVLRFAARGEEFSWRFNAATYDELVALALGGRLGLGRDVHFDAAKVSFDKGAAGKPGSVRIAIGRKVRIVAPAPVSKVAVKRPAARKMRAPRKLPAA